MLNNFHGYFDLNYKVLRLFLFIVLQSLFQILFIDISYATSSAGINYQGRLIDPTGKPVTGNAVKFKLQIRTSGNENCLLYEEEQTKDLSMTDGVYSLSINDGTGIRSDLSGYSIDQIFANRGTLTLPAGACALGNTYTPNSYDGRKIHMLFNDGTFDAGTWEAGPVMAINFVPSAIEATQLSGYKKEQILKLADGVSTTGSELNSTQWISFLALLSGSSNLYLKPTDSVTKIQGASIPTVANGESLRWNSSLGTSGGWETFTPGATITVTSIVAGQGLMVGAIPGGVITSSGTLNVDTGTTANKLLKLDANAKIPAVDGSLLTNINAASLNGVGVSSTSPTTVGQTLRFDGSVWKPDVISMTDLRSSTTGLSAFNTSCSSNQTLTYNSVGDIMSCSSISINGNQITQGNVGITYGGTGATTQAGAANAILPPQSSHVGKYLTTDGTDVSWASISSSQWTTTGTNINFGSGNVGIGTTTPRAIFDINGTMVSKAATNNGSSTIDFSNGNLQYTTSNCGAFQFNNLKDGGSYMFAVQGTTSATCSFTAYSDVGVTSLTVHLPPDHGATTVSKHTLYNLVVFGTHVYVSWIPGY